MKGKRFFFLPVLSVSLFLCLSLPPLSLSLACSLALSLFFSISHSIYLSLARSIILFLSLYFLNLFHFLSIPSYIYFFLLSNLYIHILLISKYNVRKSQAVCQNQQTR